MKLLSDGKRKRDKSIPIPIFAEMIPLSLIIYSVTGMTRWRVKRRRKEGNVYKDDNRNDSER